MVFIKKSDRICNGKACSARQIRPGFMMTITIIMKSISLRFGVLIGYSESSSFAPSASSRLGSACSPAVRRPAVRVAVANSRL